MNNLTTLAVEIYCTSLKSNYVAEYCSDLCIGEVIRNCCVNLQIDPDTVDGITLNVKVSHEVDNQWTELKYNPNKRLSTLARDGVVALRFELLA